MWTILVLYELEGSQNTRISRYARRLEHLPTSAIEQKCVRKKPLLFHIQKNNWGRKEKEYCKGGVSGGRAERSEAGRCGCPHHHASGAYGEVQSYHALGACEARGSVATRPSNSSKRYDKTTYRNIIHSTTPIRKADRGLCVCEISFCVVRKD